MNKAFEKNLEIEKIKVASAEIVVHGTSKKPYYEIRYYDISDGKYHIGYSSYDLSIVFGWLKECFEIVHEIAEEYTSTEHINCSTNTSTDTSTNGWIPCSERLPDDLTDVLVWFEYYRFGNYNGLYQTIGISYTNNGEWSRLVNGMVGWNALRIIAWQPLPQPPKGE